MRYTGRVTLPDGRRFIAAGSGHVEFDTNAYVASGDMEITNLDTDEELTREQQNEEIEVDGKLYYLHEYISEHADWRADD